MGEFFYTACHELEGQRFSGRLRANSRGAAMAVLGQKYKLVVQLEPIERKIWFGGRHQAVRGEHLLAFTQAMAAMVEAGMSYKKALDVLAPDIESERLSQVVRDLSNELSEGNLLSKGLNDFPDVFDDFYLNLVLAGEQSGTLPLILRRLADHIEKTETIREKLRAAMVYPALVITFACVMFTLMLGFGVPELRQLYGSMGVSLPGPTALVVNAGMLVASHAVVLSVLALVGLFLLGGFLRSPQGIAVIDRTKMRLPIFRGLCADLYTGRFARTLGTLYSSGVPLLDALSLTSSAIANTEISGQIMAMRERIKGGDSLATEMRKLTYFRGMGVGMIAAGEEAGSMETMLAKVADYFEMRVMTRISGLLSVLEPLLMIGVGILIGSLIVILGMPFLNMASIL